MAALSDEIGTLKFVHTYGVGLHSDDSDPDVHDPRWQRRQIDDFVEFAVLAEELGFDGEFFPVERPTTIATRPLQDRLPVWLGGSSRETMRLAAARGWNVMRNFGSNAEHRDALDEYVKVAAEHGHAVSGANLMIERFVAVGATPEQAERNLDNMARAFGTFLKLYLAGGGRVIPETDAEFHVEGITGAKGRPVIAVSGTPDQVIDGLQQVIDETGARRLLVETFSRDEARLFAEEVIPVLRERNA